MCTYRKVQYRELVECGYLPKTPLPKRIERILYMQKRSKVYMLFKRVFGHHKVADANNDLSGAPLFQDYNPATTQANCRLVRDGAMFSSSIRIYGNFKTELRAEVATPWLAIGPNNIATTAREAAKILRERTEQVASELERFADAAEQDKLQKKGLV